MAFRLRKQYCTFIISQTRLYTGYLNEYCGLTCWQQPHLKFILLLARLGLDKPPQGLNIVVYGHALNSKTSMSKIFFDFTIFLSFLTIQYGFALKFYYPHEPKPVLHNQATPLTVPSGLGVKHMMDLDDYAPFAFIACMSKNEFIRALKDTSVYNIILRVSLASFEASWIKSEAESYTSRMFAWGDSMNKNAGQKRIPTSALAMCIACVEYEICSWVKSFCLHSKFSKHMLGVYYKAALQLLQKIKGDAVKKTTLKQIRKIIWRKGIFRC
ncbi:hypothetical protein SERLA73DRAFT_150206 [Serpula lacrymans var. lacrymans S7.3]|uniref:Uncharacterized protein n=1 Tax=Serpula lacrymans var. lacrymans (strain S7.3) TaxID=936435 RepID=F8PLH9_SERL3|nr:hypothetical protein SERLA73DRAFT_150206 [Serpula lacrymans var. lacrymans S7.3]